MSLPSPARTARGRGTAISNASLNQNKCLCERPHSMIICAVCGYWTKGRVRYACPLHPKTVFLFDFSQCPKCKSCGFMLSEF